MIELSTNTWALALVYLGAFVSFAAMSLRLIRRMIRR